MMNLSALLKSIEEIHSFCTQLGFDVSVQEQYVHCQISNVLSCKIVPEEVVGMVESDDDNTVLIYSPSGNIKSANTIGKTEVESLIALKQASTTDNTWKTIASMIFTFSGDTLESKIQAIKNVLIISNAPSCITSEQPEEKCIPLFRISFEEWLQEKQYRPTTVNKYILALQKVGERLPISLGRSILEITDMEELQSAIQQIKSDSNYAYINRKYGNGDLSAALGAYTKYLIEMTGTDACDDVTKKPSKKKVKSKAKVKKQVTVSTPSEDQLLVDGCLEQIKQLLSIEGWKHVNKRDKIYQTEDDKVGVLCLLSKSHRRAKIGPNFWYGYHPSQKDKLQKFEQAYVAFAFKDNNEFVLMPVSYLNSQLSNLSITNNVDGSMYWHVKIWYIDGKYLFEIPNQGRRSIEEFAMHSKAELQSQSPSTPMTDEKDSEVAVIKIKSTAFKAIKKKH